MYAYSLNTRGASVKWFLFIMLQKAIIMCLLELSTWVWSSLGGILLLAGSICWTIFVTFPSGGGPPMAPSIPGVAPVAHFITGVMPVVITGVAPLIAAIPGMAPIALCILGVAPIAVVIPGMAPIAVVVPDVAPMAVVVPTVVPIVDVMPGVVVMTAPIPCVGPVAAVSPCVIPTPGAIPGVDAVFPADAFVVTVSGSHSSPSFNSIKSVSDSPQSTSSSSISMPSSAMTICVNSLPNLASPKKRKTNVIETITQVTDQTRIMCKCCRSF